MKPLCLELSIEFPQIEQNAEIAGLIQRFSTLHAQTETLKAEAAPSPYDLESKDMDFVQKFNAMLDNPIPTKYVEEFGDLTIRQTLEGDTQKFFAKGEMNLFGPTSYYLFSSPKKFMVVAKDFYDLLTLPILKSYTGNWTAQAGYDSAMENDLERADRNIAQKIIVYLQREFHRALIPLSIQQLSIAV